MTKEELEKELEILDKREFYLNMVDRWEKPEKELYERISNEKTKIKRQLEEMVK